MCKYIAQFIYFHIFYLFCLFSLSCLTLSWKKLTGKKVGSIMRKWMNNLSGSGFIIQVPYIFSFPPYIFMRWRHCQWPKYCGGSIPVKVKIAIIRKNKAPPIVIAGAWATETDISVAASFLKGQVASPTLRQPQLNSTVQKSVSPLYCHRNLTNIAPCLFFKMLCHVRISLVTLWQRI